MPTYVYRRQDGTTFEIEQRITADPLTTCPTTGQAVSRVITGGTGLIFKGDGFYLTDYARKKPAEKDASSSNGSSETTDKATDKKSTTTTTDSAKAD